MMPPQRSAVRQPLLPLFVVASSTHPTAIGLFRSCCPLHNTDSEGLPLNNIKSWTTASTTPHTRKRSTFTFVSHVINLKYYVTVWNKCYRGVVVKYCTLVDSHGWAQPCTLRPCEAHRFTSSCQSWSSEGVVGQGIRAIYLDWEWLFASHPLRQLWQRDGTAWVLIA